VCVDRANTVKSWSPTRTQRCYGKQHWREQ